MYPGGFVRQIRPQLFATSDRTLVGPRFMFVSSDRTWLPCASKTLTSANDQPLVGADEPQSRLRSLLADTGVGSLHLGSVQSGEYLRLLLTNEITQAWSKCFFHGSVGVAGIVEPGLPARAAQGCGSLGHRAGHVVRQRDGLNDALREGRSEPHVRPAGRECRIGELLAGRVHGAGGNTVGLAGGGHLCPNPRLA